MTYDEFLAQAAVEEAAEAADQTPYQEDQARRTRVELRALEPLRRLYSKKTAESQQNTGDGHRHFLQQ